MGAFLNLRKVLEPLVIPVEGGTISVARNVTMPTLYFVFRRLPPVIAPCILRIHEKRRAALRKAEYPETMRRIVGH